MSSNPLDLSDEATLQQELSQYENALKMGETVYVDSTLLWDIALEHFEYIWSINTPTTAISACAVWLSRATEMPLTCWCTTSNPCPWVQTPANTMSI